VPRTAGAHIAPHQSKPNIAVKSAGFAAQYVTARGSANALRQKETDMKHLISRLLTWIDRHDERALEDYLARSGNVAELERRMREWEWRGVK
jgi:hypothetical protein